MFGNIGFIAVQAITLILGLLTCFACAADSPALQRGPAGPAIKEPSPQQVPGPANKDVPAQRLNAPTVLQGDELTMEQFKKLPDSAVIDLNGSRTTAGQIRAKIRQFEVEVQAKGKTAAAPAEAKFEA